MRFFWQAEVLFGTNFTVLLPYHCTKTVLLLHYCTALLLYYYCTYQASDFVDCGGECRKGKVFKIEGF